MIPGVVDIEGGLPVAAPMDWDAEPVSPPGLFGRLRDPAVRRDVQRAECTQSAYAHLNVAHCWIFEGLTPPREC